MTTIREFQKMMREIYYHHDMRRGAADTCRWLESEVRELRDALCRGDRENMAEEFADVLAWLCSLANLLEVDLEAAAVKRYPGKCPKCGCRPCSCPYRGQPSD